MEQQTNNFFVLETFTPYVVTDLTNLDTPASQKLALVFENVFIENVHLANGSSANLSLCLNSA